jgi:beta-lactamase regulating signal transducer with metallopeptidase domain
MNAVLWCLGQNTITVALLIPCVLVACRLVRNRPAVQHVLWVVVLLKFVTPPIVSWPWTVEQIRDSLCSTRASAPAATELDGERPARQIILPNEGEHGKTAGLTPRPEGQPGKGSSSKAPERKQAAVAWTPITVASGGPDLVEITVWVVSALWLVGATVSLMWQYRRIARHAGIIRHGTVAPDQVIQAIEASAREFGVRPPRAVLARGILSPFLWCLGPLRLVWPERMTSQADVERSRGVIAHELAHIRRGDHWVAWLELAAGVVWWWNPLFLFVRRRLRETADMACDALAIRACPESRREYAEMLLELSAGCRSGVPAPVLAVSTGTPSSFERRLSMILSDRVSGKVPPWGFLLAICLALVALPDWSLAQTASSKEGGDKLERITKPSGSTRPGQPVTDPASPVLSKEPATAARSSLLADKTRPASSRQVSGKADEIRIRELTLQFEEAKLEVTSATERYEFLKRMAAKGYTPATQVKVQGLAIKRAQLKADLLKVELDLLRAQHPDFSAPATRKDPAEKAKVIERGLKFLYQNQNIPATPAPATPSPVSRRAFEAKLRTLELDIAAAELKFRAARGETGRQFAADLAAIEVERAKAALELFRAQHPEFSNKKKPATDRSTDGPQGQERNPPPRSVEGKITKIDKTGLVRLSVGHDAGLEKGHTLGVYRLGPKPLYLGVVEVLEVEPGQAVGRLRRPMKEQIKVGDCVGTLMVSPARAQRLP